MSERNTVTGDRALVILPLDGNAVIVEEMSCDRGYNS